MQRKEVEEDGGTSAQNMRGKTKQHTCSLVKQRQGISAVRNILLETSRLCAPLACLDEWPQLREKVEELELLSHESGCF